MQRLSKFTIFILADLDECVLGNASCPSGYECVNTLGTYRCRVRCPDGFVMTDNDTCVGNTFFLLFSFILIILWFFFSFFFFSL